MIGQRLLNKLVNNAVYNGWNSFSTEVWNAVPVRPFDHLSNSIYDAYCKNDMIYSIANKKATTGARAPFSVYQVKSIKAMKEYKRYMSQKDVLLKDALELKDSAVEPVNHPLNDKFANPNPGMSESEYNARQLLYLNLTGNAFELTERNGKRLLDLNILPADYMEILVKTGVVPYALGYQINWGVYQKFEVEDIIHAKYPNPRWTFDGKHLYGMSPIEVLWNLIQAEEEGTDAIAEQRKNRGPRKLVGIKNDKITNYLEGKKMMDGLRDNFNERARDYKDRLMPIWGDVNVNDMGLSDEALNMAATSDKTFQRFCNVFNVPYQWFSTTSESKYSNLEIYNKQAILNGVVPDLNILRDARDRYFRQLGTIGQAQVIDYDISVFSELNVDRGSMWQYLKDMPLTENDKLKEMGYDGYNNPALDQVLVNRNRIPITNINDINHEKQNGQNDTSANQGTSGEGES